jgi:hypothetical protein
VSALDDARAALRRLPARRLAAVDAGARAFDVDAVLARAEGGELVLWDAPAVGGARAETVVALGRIASVEASGLERFARAAADGQRLLAGVAAVGEARPRLFGGFSFEADDADDEAWSAFGAASFILPRVLFERRDGAARATVFGEAGELARDGAVEALMDGALGGMASPSLDLVPKAASAGRIEVGLDASLPAAPAQGDGDEAFARMTEAALAEIARGGI